MTIARLPELLKASYIGSNQTEGHYLIKMMNFIQIIFKATNTSSESLPRFTANIYNQNRSRKITRTLSFISIPRFPIYKT